MSLCLVAIVTIGVSQVPGAVIYVDGSNTTPPWDGSPQNPYQTIGDAVSAQTTVDGDEIRVLAGTYRETVSLTPAGGTDKQLAIKGWDAGSGELADPADVIVDGEGTRRCLEIDDVGGSGVSLHALTLREGYTGGYGAAAFVRTSIVTLTGVAVEDSSAGTGGGGVYVESSSAITLTECTIDGNWTYLGSGGGIYADGSTLTLTGCTVSSNGPDPGDYFYTYSGGGIYGQSSSDVTLTGCTTSGNESYWGGAICVQDESSLHVIGCNISDNEAQHAGGGVYCSGSTLGLQGNCTISGNEAAGGGGIAIAGGNAQVSDCIVRGC